MLKEDGYLNVVSVQDVRSVKLYKGGHSTVVIHD